MRHHFAAYGFWAPSIGNYVQHKITQRTGTPELAKLYELVDPYSYRDRLTMPKFILNAAGDQFFLPDSSQFYYDDLQGEKYLRYVPNTDHGMGRSDATESLAAFYWTIMNDKPRPQYTWTREGDNSLRVTTKDKPTKVTLWQATNPNARDFRLEMIGPAYKPTELQAESDGVYVGKVETPEKGFKAFFVEMQYDVGAPVPLKLTTEVRVVPDVLPFQDQDPAKGELQKTPRRRRAD
jgi:PhoPQ-activated pathogenicity-related protein